MADRTFVMVKPDGVGRRLVGEVIRRYEAKGLKLAGLKMQIMTAELAGKHYEEHAAKPFFGELVSFITSGPSVQMVWEGPNAVEIARKLNGATNPANAELGSIRGDLATAVQNNLVHASDSNETAAREIGLYFNASELWSYGMPDDRWLQ